MLAGLHAVADLDRLGEIDELADELVVGLFLHEETRRRHADLTGIAEFHAGKQVATPSVSTSSNTKTGAWPPSSMVARFMCVPASEASNLPTGTEPVNEILRMVGEATRYSEISFGTP